MQPTTEKQSPYAFFVAGHVYGKPGVNNPGVHPPFKAQFNFLRNDTTLAFGVFTGDIVIKSTAKNWDEIDADVKALGVPVHFAVGNHDEGHKELFQSRYGATYYSFRKNNDLHLVLNSNLGGWNIIGEQLEWLKKELAGYAEGGNVFVYVHHVMWWEENGKYRTAWPNSKEHRHPEPNFETEVAPLFDTLPNPVYFFAGDVGAFANGREFFYHRYDNITLITSGMGGEERDNFIFVAVDEDGNVDLRLIALNGNNIDGLGKLEEHALKE